MYTKSLLITGPKAPKARTSPPVQGKPKNKTRQTGQDQARTRQTKTQKGPDKAKQNWRTTEAPKTCTGYGGCLIQFVTEFQMKFTTVLTVEIFQTSPQSRPFSRKLPIGDAEKVLESIHVIDHEILGIHFQHGRATHRLHRHQKEKTRPATKFVLGLEAYMIYDICFKTELKFCIGAGLLILLTM